jgi:membrane associated rhomboid family serine protease
MRLLNSFLYPFIFLCLLWLIWIYQHFTGHNLYNWGVYPRHIEGLKGILTMPLIHEAGSTTHLMSNTIPLFTLGAGIIFFYPEVAARVWVLIYLLTGSLVWLIARASEHNEHIGASGLIYGFAAFLFFEGIFRKNLRLMAISLLVLLYYGIIVAYIYKNKGPKPKQHDWENENDTDEGPSHISRYYEVKP